MHLKVILFTLTKYRIKISKKTREKLTVFIKIQISRKHDVTKNKKKFKASLIAVQKQLGLGDFFWLVREPT